MLKVSSLVGAANLLVSGAYCLLMIEFSGVEEGLHKDHFMLFTSQILEVVSNKACSVVQDIDILWDGVCSLRVET